MNIRDVLTLSDENKYVIASKVVYDNKVWLCLVDINDNKKMGNNIVCIIHGIGSGALKEEVHNTLKKNKDVIDYKLFYNNAGCTIVKINIENK